MPEGKSKRERWMRIATESAKQSRRTGVMRIEPLTSLETAIAAVKANAGNSRTGWFFTTEIPGLNIGAAIESARAGKPLTLFIGPEGGWTENELAAFQASEIIPVRLWKNILRIETAAVAAAAIVAALLMENGNALSPQMNTDGHR